MKSKSTWNIWLYGEMQRAYLITSHGFHCSAKAKQKITSIYCGFKAPSTIMDLFTVISISDESDNMLWKIMKSIQNETNVTDSVAEVKKLGNIVFKKNELHLAKLLYKMAYEYCCHHDVSYILQAQLCNNLSSIFCKNTNWNEATKWNELALNYHATYNRAVKRKIWLLAHK